MNFDLYTRRSRYPDLHAKYCAAGRCDTRALHDHFKNEGHAKKWRWGCGSLPTFEERLERFEAPNPADTDWCRRAMRSGQTGPLKNNNHGSQYGQDMTMFMNLFRDKEPVDPGTGFYKGFYVDSGANDFQALSNTLFFDKCLGWDGLCVEPNPAYHANHRAHRSCTLVPEIIAAQPGFYDFGFGGVMGSVRGAESAERTARQKTPANPLDVMLLRANRTSLYVDFWSLDVEGFEMTVLGAIDFEKIRVDSILVEDFWIANRPLDRLLTGNGFLKLRQMQIDSIWVNRLAVADLRPTYWESAHDGPERWEHTIEFRDKMRKQGKLAKDL